jgi:hypothetical protein
MDMEFKNLLMEILIWGSLLKASLKGMVFTNGKMAVCMKVSSNTVKDKEEGSGNLIMKMSLTEIM